MTAVMNTSALSSIIDQDNAARLKAEADYYAIAFDATRDTPADQKALASAMRILGKSVADVAAEQEAIVAAGKLAQAAADHAPAQADKEAAEQEFGRFLKEDLPAMQRAVEDAHHAKRYASAPHVSRMQNAAAALVELRKLRTKTGLKDPRVARLLPSDPPGSPDQIRTAGYLLHDRYGNQVR
ncbi:MAG TPA: hypothetical protein VFC78_18305 [Tepidisphaeraceae bacterium]|nr:hypothetical protein [Tepidisphaeraceae bacterium]